MANKYPGFCIVCRQQVGVGHGELTRSATGAWFVKCSGGKVAVSTTSGARRSGRRGTWTGCQCGSVSEYTKASDCWTCKHDAE